MESGNIEDLGTKMVFQGKMCSKVKTNTYEPYSAAIGGIFCGRHFENGLRDTMNEQIFTVNILVSCKRIPIYTYILTLNTGDCR